MQAFQLKKIAEGKADHETDRSCHMFGEFYKAMYNAAKEGHKSIEFIHLTDSFKRSLKARGFKIIEKWGKETWPKTITWE